MKTNFLSACFYDGILRPMLVLRQGKIVRLQLKKVPVRILNGFEDNVYHCSLCVGVTAFPFSSLGFALVKIRSRDAEAVIVK